MSVDTGSKPPPVYSYGAREAAPQTGVGFFGYETEDEKKLKAVAHRYKEDLESKNQALAHALDENKLKTQALKDAKIALKEAEKHATDAEQRDLADRATIEEIRQQLMKYKDKADLVDSTIAEGERLKAELASETERMKSEYEKSVTESDDYKKASSTISELQAQISGLTANLTEMTNKFEHSELLRNELASKLVVIEAKEKSMEALVKVQEQKVAIANQTVDAASKVFDSTVKTLEKESSHNLEALNLRNKRSYDSNKIIRDAVERASALISIPPSKPLTRKHFDTEIASQL